MNDYMRRMDGAREQQPASRTDEVALRVAGLQARSAHW
jgi:hypothetical protein